MSLFDAAERFVKENHRRIVSMGMKGSDGAFSVPFPVLFSECIVGWSIIGKVRAGVIHSYRGLSCSPVEVRCKSGVSAQKDDLFQALYFLGLLRVQFGQAFLVRRVHQEFGLKRAPQHDVLLRCFVGGPGREELVDLSDEEMIAMVRQELAEYYQAISDTARLPVFIQNHSVGSELSVATMARVVRDVERVEHLVELVVGLGADRLPGGRVRSGEQDRTGPGTRRQGPHRGGVPEPGGGESWRVACGSEASSASR